MNIFLPRKNKRTDVELKLEEKAEYRNQGSRGKEEEGEEEREEEAVIGVRCNG